MVLHPQHKLSYFNKAAQWEDDWIKTAEQLVREEFERSYLSVDVDSDLGCGEDVLESNGDIWMSDNIFDNLPALTAPKPITWALNSTVTLVRTRNMPPTLSLGGTNVGNRSPGWPLTI